MRWLNPENRGSRAPPGISKVFHLIAVMFSGTAAVAFFPLLAQRPPLLKPVNCSTPSLPSGQVMSVFVHSNFP